MNVSRTLLRLLHVRNIEEEQRRMVLESALGELHALEAALAASHARRREGEALLVRSVGSSDIADRTAAQVEVAAAQRQSAVIGPRIAAAEIAAARARQEYLGKRLERRQAQTLIEESQAQASRESGRRDQQSLDEAFGARRHQQKRDANRGGNQD